MSDTPAGATMWSRAVSDREFCEALIADPLRALAAHPDVTASPEQVRRLEAMDLADRDATVREVVREVTLRRAREQWGDRAWSPDDGPALGDGVPFDVAFQAEDTPTPRRPEDDDNDEEAYVS